MQKIQKLLILLSLGIASLAYSSTSIQIDHDEDDCVDGWSSMDVTIKVGNESFDLDPSCSFSFDKDLKTKAGLECEVEAGMCSSFSPKNKLEVSCDDGSSDSVEIQCPKEKE